MLLMAKFWTFVTTAVYPSQSFDKLFLVMRRKTVAYVAITINHSFPMIKNNKRIVEQKRECRSYRSVVYLNGPWVLFLYYFDQ